MTTRGERNCNPGNIVRDGTKWAGMAADQTGDSRFIVFSDAVYGIRALGRVLLAYYNVHGLRTVRDIIGRWAPPVENDTLAYVNAVAQACGVQPDDAIDVSDVSVLASLITAIIHHENGRVSYPAATIIEGAQKALA